MRPKSPRLRLRLIQSASETAIWPTVRPARRSVVCATAFSMSDVSDAAFLPLSRLELDQKPRWRAIWPKASANSSLVSSRDNASARSCQGSRPALCFSASALPCSSMPSSAKSRRRLAIRCRRLRMTRRWPRFSRRIALVGLRSLSVSGASKHQLPASMTWPASSSSRAQPTEAIPPSTPSTSPITPPTSRKLDAKFATCQEGFGKLVGNPRQGGFLRDSHRVITPGLGN